MRDELRSIFRESEIPVILVTHDYEAAIKLGDVVQIVDNGEASVRGSPEAILGSANVGLFPDLMRQDNVLSVVVNKLEPEFGTMVGISDGVSLILPFVESEVGESLLFGISSRDVVLSAEKPIKIGAENIMEGRIQHISFHGTGYDITIDCGVQIVSYVTQPAFRNMELEISSQVWVVSQTSSWDIVQDKLPVMR